MSHNDAAPARPAAARCKLVVAETPDVLRRGLRQRSAARAQAEQAVKKEQQDRLDSLRRQMASYKKAAVAKPAKARAVPVRPPTVPQPFQLHEVRPAAAAAGQPPAEFRSLAQMVQGFQRKTPPRFHTRPAGERPAGAAEARPASPHVTVGHTPALMTRGRTRSLNVPTREQLEQAELEECKQHQVRARPVNRRVLEQTVGVPAKRARSATRAEPFALTEVVHKQPEPADEAAEAAAREFHARPAPRQILEAAQGVPERRPAARTQPQSPALALKQRMAERRREIKEQKESGGVVRANPLPDAGVPFTPKIDHKSTRPEPFSFETRDKQRQLEKERKIQQVLEEERRQREFRAQLLPALSPRGVPERRPPAATRPQPFQLPGEQQAAAAAARRQKKLEEEEARQRAALEFHAQPCLVTARQPFQPRPAERGPTAAHTPQLHTVRRSERRQSFEQRQKQREAELQAAREEAERQRELAEQREAARARREAVHHAQPVRRFRPVRVQPSDVPLTTPRSPNWHADSSRASYRSQ